MKFILLLFLATVCISGCVAKCVNTKEGKISGVELTSRKGRKIHAFTGIPYAEPPVGPRRFSNPVPKAAWGQTLKAHNDPPECLQKKNGVIHGSEDCLYLNVFTPELKPKQPLPVMLHLPGGSFLVDNSSLITSGPQYLLDKDVVLVTCNYRLGIFGFISTGDEVASGNFGIKDVVLVLEWVQRNIHAFGGNSNEVTLLGQGSGGEIVHLLTFVEKAKPLFKRVIMQSGGALYPQSFASHSSYYAKAKQVAGKHRCPTTNSVLLVGCLRGLEPSALLNTDVFDKWDLATGISWRPTKEPVGLNSVLVDTPEKLIRHKRMKHCPVISGNVKDEATNIIQNIASDEELLLECERKPVEVIKRLLEYYDPIKKANVNNLAIKVKNYYLGEKLPRDRNVLLYKYSLLLSDLLYFFPQQQFQDYIVKIKAESFYSYQFKYRGALSFGLPLQNILPKCAVAHSDDNFYLYPLSAEIIGPQYENLQRTQQDYEIVDAMLDLWATFSNDSVPKSSSLGIKDQWKPLTSNEYLQIGSGVSDTKTSIQSESQSERIKFWYDNAPRYKLTCS